MRFDLFRLPLLLALSFFLCSCGAITIVNRYDPDETFGKGLDQLEWETIATISRIVSSNQIVDADNAAHKTINACIDDIYAVIQNKSVPRDSIRVTILDTASQQCYSAPPAYIFISTGTITEALKADTKGMAALKGLLAHEICHINFKHTQIKWAKHAEYDEASTRRLAAFLTAIPMAVSPIRIKQEIPADAHQYTFLSWYLECTADLYALQVLHALDVDDNAYLAFFENTLPAIQREPNRVKELDLARFRIARLRAYFANPTWASKSDIGSLTLVEEMRGREIQISNFNEIKANSRQDPKNINSRSISYWIAATRQNPNWRPNVHASPLVGYDNKQLTTKDGTPLTASVYTLPLNLFGMPSFITPSYSYTIGR